jgi:hypothetical protein
VLNEIETRLHELREELQDEQGGSASMLSRQGDEESSSGSRGRVTHPENDRRLKQNRDD